MNKLAIGLSALMLASPTAQADVSKSTVKKIVKREISRDNRKADRPVTNKIQNSIDSLVKSHIALREQVTNLSDELEQLRAAFSIATNSVCPDGMQVSGILDGVLQCTAPMLDTPPVTVRGSQQVLQGYQRNVEIMVSCALGEIAIGGQYTTYEYTNLDVRTAGIFRYPYPYAVPDINVDAPMSYRIIVNNTGAYSASARVRVWCQANELSWNRD